MIDIALEYSLRMIPFLFICIIFIQTSLIIRFLSVDRHNLFDRCVMYMTLA